jgi:hypothetical protein
MFSSITFERDMSYATTTTRKTAETTVENNIMAKWRHTNQSFLRKFAGSSD